MKINENPYSISKEKFRKMFTFVNNVNKVVLMRDILVY